MAQVPEEHLPLYGLAADWRGDRRLREHGGRKSSDVLNVWAGVHYTPVTGEEIVVRTQRRAIDGGLDPEAPPVTGSEQLVKLDAAWAMVAASRAADGAALREATDPSDWKRVHAAYSQEMDDVAQEISRQDEHWKAADLTIDGVAVNAIEATCDGWWVVLHLGVGEVADVFVYGPPGARPTPLKLETVSADAYPSHHDSPDSPARD
ncbi:MAG: hypothetical protein ABSC56_10990 [Solirubrobacteraceae bacterium]|jgi:hypothetical protein